MAAESLNVMTKRELTKEVAGALHTWLNGYTDPWSDMAVRKLVVHAVDYENGILEVEVRHPDDHTYQATEDRYHPDNHTYQATEDRYLVTVTVEKKRRT